MKKRTLIASLFVMAAICTTAQAGQKMAGPTFVPATPAPTGLFCHVSSVGLNMVRHVTLQILDHVGPVPTVVGSTNCGNLVKNGICDVTLGNPSATNVYSCLVSTRTDNVGALRGVFNVCDVNGCERIPLQ